MAGRSKSPAAVRTRAHTTSGAFSFSAPNRIDLAGGTLDIYPLYIFEDGGVTVNAAVSIKSHVEVAPRRGKGVSITSVDFGQSIDAPSTEELSDAGPLGLIARAVKFYAPRGGLDVTTLNRAPRGSGLGASSSLLMALSVALTTFTGAHVPRESILSWGANLEARSLGIPTGKQDYFAALYGGVQAIHFDVKGERSEQLRLSAGFRRQLESRLVLTFTGISHFSGTSNWNMMKRYIDARADTVTRMGAIGRTARLMRDALLHEDMDALTGAIAQEWENRKGLAKGVTNARIERLVAFITSLGGAASKICGAGGGGCLLTLAGVGKKEKIVTALKEKGYRVLDFGLESRGVAEEPFPC